MDKNINDKDIKSENISFENFLKIRNLESRSLASDEAWDGEGEIKPVPKPIPWKEMNKRNYPELPFIIKGLIPTQGFVIIASVSGEKKTWLAMEMAKCISSGTNFLDDNKFKTAGCNVLYINCENPESDIARRGKQLGYKEDGPYKLYFFNNDNLNLNDDDGATWLLSVIEYYKIGVVFIDTLRAVSPGIKENESGEVRGFFSRFTSLKNKGVTLVFLDHTRKPSNLDGKVPKKEHLLGSQDKTASVEVLLMIKSENGSEEIDCYQRKNRLAVEIKPFKIKMKDEINPNGNIQTKLTYAGEIEDQENKKEEAKEIILNALSDNDKKTTKQILELTKKQVGAKNTRIALGELVEQGLLSLEKKGRENLYFVSKDKETIENLVLDNEKENFFDSS